MVKKKPRHYSGPILAFPLSIFTLPCALHGFPYASPLFYRRGTGETRAVESTAMSRATSRGRSRGRNKERSKERSKGGSLDRKVSQLRGWV